MPFQLVDLIDVAGGEVYGKIRLQKMIFLLDNLGLESNYSFSYHHYGPYSSELADKIISEVNSSKIIEEQKRRMSDGVSYSVFKVRKKREKKINKKIGKLDYIEIKKYIDIINKYNSTILELSATALWLFKNENNQDWRKELERRKGIKTREGRTEEAVRLLKEIGLELGGV